jgi:hypothetical protein
MSATPPNTIGMVANARAVGRSRWTAQAIRPTNAIWVFASTVASPAPISSMERCQTVRSSARKRPLPAAIQRIDAERWSPPRVIAHSRNSGGSA